MNYWDSVKSYSANFIWLIYDFWKIVWWMERNIEVIRIMKSESMLIIYEEF